MKQKTGRKLLSFLLTLAMLVGLMPGMSLTAYADNTEELLTTLTFGGSSTYSETKSGVVSVTATNVTSYNDTYGWLFFDVGSLSVTAEEGYTINKCVFRQNNKQPITDTEAPFEIHFSDGCCTEDTNWDMDGVTSIEVYRYVTPTTVDVTGVSLNKTTTTLTVGDTETLTATVSPDGATDKTVTWSSSDTDVATVENGVVTAVGSGTANITVTATNGTDDTSDDKTATCAVTVNAAIVTSAVTLNVNGGTINSGNITEYTEGTGATLPTDVTKDGHQFGGWYDNAGLTGSPVTAISTSDTGNKEYWAKWTANPSSVSYSVVFKVVNGSWDDGTTADKIVTLTGNEGDTLKLTTEQIPAVGTKPNNGYKAGSWDVTPSTDTAITEATTYTYTYAQKDSINQTVTFKVVNGSWNDETTTDKTVTLTGYEGDTLKLAATDIPAVGTKPNDTYKAGSWDTTPSADTEITGATTYTYTYAQKDSISLTVTFKVVNGSWNDETTTDKTATLTGYEGDTLKLTADQIPTVGTKPNDTYKAGSWDVMPNTDTAITEATTYTYTYAQKDSISQTVTFKVVNGSWNDETTTDKTVTLTGYEGDTLKLAATDIPAVGTKPNDTYKAGSWDVTPSADTEITGATTYTYTYALKDSISQTVTFKVVNGSWNDETTTDKTVTLTGYEGDTLKLTADQIPTVGTKPNDTYKAGNWDVTPSTDTAITEATTYTYTYVAKEASVVTKAPEAKTLTYNESAQELVTAGTATGGEMQYALGTATEATQPYTTSIPTATDAGTYYVWYKVVGDANHLDSEAKPVEAAIGSVDSNTAAPTELTLTYDGSGQPLVKPGSVDYGTLFYALGSNDTTAPTDGWSTEVPTATEAGTYYVWYKVVGDANHNDVDPACVVVTIGEAAAPATTTIVAPAASTSDYTLLASLKTSGKKALKMRWTAVPGAEGYDVFFGMCNKGDCQLLASVNGTSYKIKGLKKGFAYKAYVRAWKNVGGAKVYIGEPSPDVHAITNGKSNRYTNPKKISVKKKKLTVGVGKTKAIKAKLKKFSDSREYLNHVSAKVRYYSSDRAVATVSANGRVTGVGPGKCTVFAVAENGLRVGVKVTVK